MDTGTAVDIEQIDPANRAALAAWHATVLAADTFGREDTATPWQLPEVEAELAEQTDVTRLVFAGIEDGRTVVVSGQVGLPLRHSTHHADVLNEKNWAKLDKLNAVAERTGHSLLEFAFGWLLAKPIIGSVIAGATKPEQIEQNVAAAAKRPSPAVIAEIDAITA